MAVARAAKYVFLRFVEKSDSLSQASLCALALKSLFEILLRAPAFLSEETASLLLSHRACTASPT